MGTHTIDVTAVRAATPGCAEVVHFNNAGAALPPKVVTDAVLEYTAREALMGGYEAQDAAAAESWPRLTMRWRRSSVHAASRSR